MTSSTALAHRPELDEFLYAAIGEERNGMLLTVLSALGRLGLDPWSEADRFSDMPKTLAAQMLAPMIARLPEGLWAAADAQAIATRLVKLLPQRREQKSATAPGSAVAGAQKPMSTAAWLLCAALLAAAVVTVTSGRDLSLARFLDPSPATSSGIDNPPPAGR